MTALADPLESKPFPDTEQLGYQPRDIVLLGAGGAHLFLLEHLTKHPLVGATLTLVAAQPRHVVASKMADVVAGHQSLEDCSIAIEPLVRRAGVRWLQRSVAALDADASTLQLDDGSALHYDLLSVNTGPLHQRALTESTVPGARQHALFALPGESFGVLWPQVLEMGRQRALRVAVIGDNANALELAMAVRHVLPSASITLVAGPQGIGYFAPEPQRLRIARALKQRQITVLHDTATALNDQAVSLGCGATLACDVPLYAGAAQPAPWMTHSALAADTRGFAVVNANRVSTSHPNVWSMDDDRDLRHAQSIWGPMLAAQLAASVAGNPLPPVNATTSRLHTLRCGSRHAIGSWGPLGLEGRWLWNLQQRIDHKALERYRSPH